jgi:hypothetical protein
MRRKSSLPKRRATLEEAPPSRSAPSLAKAPAATGPRRPLVAALVPDPDVWRVSGAGRTLVARRRADGRIAWASVAFDLKHPAGITFFGNPETEEGPFEEILDALYQIEDALPVIGGTASLASRFAHGALALARAVDPKLTLDPNVLSVFGDPRGGDAGSLAALTGPDGLCPPELFERCAQEAAAGLAEGEALAVHVAMAFKAHSPRELERALASDPDFGRHEEDFAWRPARAAGKRLGSVYLHEGDLEAETVTLNLAGLLCGRLKRLSQGQIELTRVQHKPLE